MNKDVEKKVKILEKTIKTLKKIATYKINSNDYVSYTEDIKNLVGTIAQLEYDLDLLQDNLDKKEDAE